MVNYNLQLPTLDDFENLFKKLIKEQSSKIETNSSLSQSPISNLLTRSQLAKKLSISLTTLHKHTKEGMPSIRIGKRRLYDPFEVAKYFKSKNLK
jgi:hypothetical protein